VKQGIAKRIANRSGNADRESRTATTSMGLGLRPHRHPYPEVFVIHAGRAEFRLGEDDVDAGTGDVVIAPTGVVHSFTATGQSDLRLTAIHPATRIETEWLTDA